MTPDFPVWTIRPNWRGGILERLEWLTDVMPSITGSEQRRALRLSPRRFVEITVNPTNQERAFLDLVLHSLGSNRWLFPLWFDQGQLAAGASLGGNRVEFDNTYREHRTGGLALLYADAFTWEVISIGDQDDDGLDLDVVLDRAWPVGTQIFPLRLTQIAAGTSLEALTSRVGESVLLFQVVEADDHNEAAPSDLTFEGLPVLVAPPNRSQSISLDHVRLAYDRDNQTGLPYRTDPAGRAFQVQSHTWLKRGRQAQAEFRDFLYWMRGRQRAMWLPSFNEDIVLSRNSALASTNLDIKKIGYSYAGGGAVIPGRDVVLIGGVTPARITALGVPLAAAEERLRVGAGLSAAVTAGTPGAFLSPARCNQDSIEITHHADNDGAMECSLSFHTFKNARNASGTIFAPIPAAVESSTPCGAIPFFYKLRVEFLNATTPSPLGGYYVAPTVGAYIDRVDDDPNFNSAISDPFQSIEFTWIEGDVPPGQSIALRMQFFFGTVGSSMRARVLQRRFGNAAFTLLFPRPGSESFGDSNGWFDVRDVAPLDWFFNI